MTALSGVGVAFSTGAGGDAGGVCARAPPPKPRTAIIAIMASEDLPSRGVSVADLVFNDGAACCIDVSLFSWAADALAAWLRQRSSQAKARFGPDNIVIDDRDGESLGRTADDILAEGDPVIHDVAPLPRPVGQATAERVVSAQAARSQHVTDIVGKAADLAFNQCGD